MQDMPPRTPEILMFLTFREGPWIIRIDVPRIPKAQRHIHIERRKLNGVYSWNNDGTRHDEHRFPKTEHSIKAAKELAAKHLGINSATLHFIVAEPITHIDLFIEKEQPQHKDGHLAGEFLLHCDDNALLLVFEADGSPNIHVVVMRIEPAKEEDGKGQDERHATTP